MTTLLFNKPYRVLTRFTDEAERRSLAHFISVPDVYPAGRLDRDSEGLLVLTDDGRVQHAVCHPRNKLPKTYWAQVEGLVDERALAALAAGVQLKDGPTAPATARQIDAPDLWPRTPPIRARKSIPTSWLELTITEGRNRQVRRMTAAVVFPTLRLVRVGIGPWSLEGLAPGQWRRLPGRPLVTIAQYVEHHLGPSQGAQKPLRRRAGGRGATAKASRTGRRRRGRQGKTPRKRSTRG